MKKIINSPETIVHEMCAGIELANPDLTFNERYKFLRKKTVDREKVTLICGGGSGHEPAHAGFIGKGMLDVAVCGDVFASPSQIQVYQAIKDSVSDKGTLLIIKNYTGDVMNFRNAASLAQMDGVTIDYVKVCDDIAVENSLYTVGRRGVAGTVLVHKIAGAAAQRGGSLAQVKAAAQKAADSVRSIGFALTSCTVPAKGSPTFDLGETELEYGVGIHGEPGIRRESVSGASELASRMVAALLAELRLGKSEPGETAILVNGFGATPLMELYLLAGAVAAEVFAAGITMHRVFVGNFMTSLDMQGASISIMKLDEELKSLLDDPCEAPAFTVCAGGSLPEFVPAQECAADAADVNYSMQTDASMGVIRGERLTLENMIYIVDKMSAVIIDNEEPFCVLDSYAGDGDFGMSIAKGFRRVKREWAKVTADLAGIGDFLDRCSLIIMEYCGGASGPFWGFAFKYAAQKAGSSRSLSIAEFAAVMQEAVRGVRETGERSFGRGAEVGDKTLMDALIPCADAWTEAAQQKAGFVETFATAAQAAVDGAKATEKIAARMGRAGTVGERSIGYPDAGAHALGIIFTAIAEDLTAACAE